MKKKTGKKETSKPAQITKVKGGIMLFLTRGHQQGDGFCEIYQKGDVVKNTLSTCSVLTDGKQTTTQIMLSDKKVAELAVLFFHLVTTQVKSAGGGNV